MRVPSTPSHATRVWVCRTQLDGFTAYYTFITEHCPRIVTGSLTGAHDGCRVLDEVLATVSGPVAAVL